MRLLTEWLRCVNLSGMQNTRHRQSSPCLDILKWWLLWASVGRPKIPGLKSHGWNGIFLIGMNGTGHVLNVNAPFEGKPRVPGRRACETSPLLGSFSVRDVWKSCDRNSFPSRSWVVPGPASKWPSATVLQRAASQECSFRFKLATYKQTSGKSSAETLIILIKHMSTNVNPFQCHIWFRSKSQDCSIRVWDVAAASGVCNWPVARAAPWQEMLHVGRWPKLKLGSLVLTVECGHEWSPTPLSYF